MSIETPLLLGYIEGHLDPIEKLSEEFEVDREALGISELLIAWFEYIYYEGSCWGLFRGNDGDLYEFSGGHCSCYGFEGQWSPEKTSLEYLRSKHFPNPAGDVRVMNVIDAL